MNKEKMTDAIVTLMKHCIEENDYNHELILSREKGVKILFKFEFRDLEERMKND